MGGSVIRLWLRIPPLPPHCFLYANSSLLFVARKQRVFFFIFLSLASPLLPCPPLYPNCLSGPENAECGNLLGSVGQFLGAQHYLSQLAYLDDSAVYRHFSCVTLEFAISPHAARPHQADAPNIKSKPPSRKWVAGHLREFLLGPNYKYAGVIDEISDAFAQTIQRVGRCRYPLYSTFSMSVHLVELRRIICMRRVGRASGP